MINPQPPRTTRSPRLDGAPPALADLPLAALAPDRRIVGYRIPMSITIGLPALFGFAK